MPDNSIPRLRARLAAHEKWAATADRTAATAPGRAAFIQKFYDATDPALPEYARLQQAQSARSAFYARLAYRSAIVRRAKRDSRKALEAADKAATE